MPRGVYPRTKRVADCHPDKTYGGNGLCRRCYNAQWRETFREKFNAYARKYRSENLEVHRARKRDWDARKKAHVAAYARARRAANPEAEKVLRLRGRLRLFGLTIEQFDEMCAAQGHRCAICREPQAGKRLAVDHDHACCPENRSCGQCIRGLICDRCNRGIGYFRDNPDLMRTAAMYVERATRSRREAA